jgi:hypothetical protein
VGYLRKASTRSVVTAISTSLQGGYSKDLRRLAESTQTIPAGYSCEALAARIFSRHGRRRVERSEAPGGIELDFRGSCKHTCT